MNARRRPLGLLAGLGLTLAAGCKPSSAPVYRFEPEPRPVLAQAGASRSRFPRLVAGRVASSTVYMLAVTGPDDGAEVSFFVSEDGGDTFRPPLHVSEKGSAPGSHGENAPGLVVVDDGPIYAAWNEEDDFRVARSLSWGSDFEKPMRVTDKPAKTWSGYASIGAAPNGDLYAVWLDSRDTDNEPDTLSVYLARSIDQGASFGKNVRVAGNVCPCCRPNLAFGPEGEVMVFWRKVYPGNIRDMTVAVTTDGGRTFSPARKVAEDNWKIAGCPDSGPATARTGHRVYIAWLTEAAPERNGVRLSWSDDGGRNWAPATLASQDVLDANYPSLATADDGRVLLAFQGRDPAKRGGWNSIGAFAVEIRPDGSLSKPMALPAASAAVMRPTIATGTAGKVFVAWTAFAAGKPEVLLERGRRME